MTALAFSPDGTRLAIGSRSTNGGLGGVDTYELEEGRGIRTLRGLRGPVPKTIFSPDGRLVAALSQDWQVAIWDGASGRLRATLDVPRGQYADNSGLAFSPDSRRFAFSAGHQAKLWDLETRTELGAWMLPAGLVDSIAFPTANQLFLMRMETQDETAAPDSRHHQTEFPRVLRLRSLLGGRSSEPVRVITDFNWHVHHATARSDGKYFVADGLSGPEGNTRTINAYNAATAAKLWSIPSGRARQGAAGFFFDPTGKVLSIELHGRTDLATLFEMPHRAALGSLDQHPISIGPGGTIWLGVTHSEVDQTLTYAIHDRQRTLPVLQIAITSNSVSVLIQFSPDGQQVVWGNSDGSVSVCDLDAVKHRLADVDLGW